MIGLEYILEVYGMQQADLAEQLGIKPQNITLWFRGKQNISKKYLPVLSEKFNIPIEYFQKELTDIDKRKIDLRYADIIVTQRHNDSNAVENYFMKKAELKEEKMLNKVRRVINDIPEPDTMDKYINLYEGNIELFDRYAKVVEGASYRGDLSYMLRAMELFNNLSKKLTEDKDIRLKEKLLTIAEQCVSDTMMEDNPLPEMMCAIMLLYDKKAKEEAEFLDNHYNP